MGYEFDGDVDCKDEVPTVRCTKCGLVADWYLHYEDDTRDVEIYRCRCENVDGKAHKKDDEIETGEFRWNGKEWKWQD